MRSNELVTALAPFAQLANKHALSPTYRSVQITPDCIRGWSSYGMMEAAVSLGVDATFALSAEVFYAVARSLPEAEEVTLKVNGGVLHWSCGAADGKLALLAEEIKALTIERPKTRGKSWKVPDDFLEALRLGSLSCGNQSLASLGIYGIVIDNRGELLVTSTDDITISSCIAGESVKVFPAMTTLSQEAVAMLVTVVGFGDDGATLEIDDKDIYCASGVLKLLLKPISALKQDIKALRDNFEAEEVTITIPHDRIAAFIKRAGALAESKAHTYVMLEVAEGAMKLAFVEGSAATDEYYLVEGLDAGDLPPIKIDAARLARVLAHTDRLVLDHLDKSVLILRGDKPSFSYMIAGRKEAA